MKNSIFILMLLVSLYSFTQTGVVTDPGNTAVNKANLVKNTAALAKAAKTLEETKKSVEILNDAKEKIEKVSTAVRDIDNLYSIVNVQSKLIDKVNNSISDVKKSNVFSSKEILNVTKNFVNIVTTSNKSLELAKKVLKNDLFNMSDTDRLNFLMKIEQDVKTNYNDVHNFSVKYNRIMNARIFKKMAKEAQANRKK